MTGGRFVCGTCKLPFKLRSKLLKHKAKDHDPLLEELEFFKNSIRDDRSRWERRR